MVKRRSKKNPDPESPMVLSSRAACTSSDFWLLAPDFCLLLYRLTAMPCISKCAPSNNDPVPINARAGKSFEKYVR